jgi:hypothetical protein
MVDYIYQFATRNPGQWDDKNDVVYWFVNFL